MILFLLSIAAFAQAPERMLSDYLQNIAAKQLAARKAEVDSITTRDAYEKRKARLRVAALRMVGGLEDERNALNARVTGTLDRPDYLVEKVVYESRPKFYVTANLYRPKKGRAPYPAILQPVGHSTSAKNRAFYQRIAIALVKTGFVVLTYDPIGQGERRIFWDKDLGDSKAGSTTEEHSMIGRQSVLGGESVARFQIWDGIRSIDYLQSRPDVDGSRIGVTGCSGGGTLTTYLAALDARVQAAAPACYISDWEDQLRGTGPQDAEQQFPDQLLEGLNHADWIGLAAPKPYLIVSTDQDFFPLEGARKTFQEMKRVYELYDAAAKVDWFHEPGGHGVPKASREAICTWMKRWLRGESDLVEQPEFPAEIEEDLNVTATGQVATSLGGETASTWNIARFSQRVPKRPVAGLAEKIGRITRYRPATIGLNIQRHGPDEHNCERLSYRSEEGLTIPGALCGTGGKLALYLDGRGKANALRPGGDVSQLMKLGYSVFAIDVSGVGEVAFRRHPGAPWGFAQVAWLGLMVGRPLAGIRMNDILRGLDALAEIGRLPARGVLAMAQGKLAVPLLHAAVLDRRIAGVVVEQSLASFRLVAASPIHHDLVDTILPDVLGQYDLPDLVAALAPRPVWLANLTSPTGQLLLRKDAMKEYETAGSHARILIRREEEPLASAYPGL